MKLTKSAYLDYLNCPREFWLAHHHPDLFKTPFSPEIINRIRIGYGVQRQAKALFERGGYGDCDFEVPFESEKLSARADVFTNDPQTGKAVIFEVKSANSVKNEYIDDLAFQKIAAEAAGIEIDRTYLVHMNKEYVRRGDIEPEKLLTIVDLTDKVDERMEATRAGIERALRCLETEPAKDIAGYCGAKLDCKFIRHHHTDLPEYTIFDINNFRGEKFDRLFADGILDIMHVPKDLKLSDKQRRQVDAAQSGTVYSEVEKIKDAVEGLAYPLYFLDYETVAHAVPLFDGYRPYQQAVFQFSLHIQEAPGSELKHAEFLADCESEPAAQVLAALGEHIAHDGGTVIVWNQSFEKGRNSEMGEMYSGYAELMSSVNERMYDLMTVFSGGHYVHPAFKGSASIKNVLPALVEGYNYKDLEIDRGMLASITWLDMHTGETPRERWAGDRANLLKYCELDTRAMVEILDVLRKEFCR